MDNIFIRKNTTQLSNVDFDLHECSGFNLDSLNDVLLEFNNKYKRLSNIIHECNIKVQEFNEAGIEQEKIQLLQEGIFTNFKQQFKELFVWFMKRLQAFAKLFNNIFYSLSNTLIFKLKECTSNDPIRIGIEWYRDDDLDMLLDTKMVDEILNSIKFDADKLFFSANYIYSVDEFNRRIKVLENVSKFKKIKMFSSESEWFRSTIACATTCIKIRDVAKSISDSVLSFTSTANSLLASMENYDDNEDISNGMSVLEYTKQYTTVCIRYLEVKEMVLKELFKLAFNNSMKILTIFKKYIDAREADKHISDIKNLSLESESYNYEIDNMFKQSHINENGEIEIYNLTNNGGM